MSTLFATTAAMLVLAPSASAASPSAACGSGYSRVGHYSVDPIYGSGAAGYLDIYYSSGTGKNCAVVYPTSENQGETTEMWVHISKANGTSADYDLGDYTYYAGPVYVSAPGDCIDAQGSLSFPGSATVPGVTFTRKLNNVHCG
ncbi:spore-associated protein A [Streptomyces sp. OR43]|uniref:spore-associated protein A n=1 Tax=Streptomyces sp. or43 TaxID=2478957 RepID=UPI0011CE3AE0|nr:spore-associated protein A [Streptomyces sp. or43]TXS38371.1 spore-associated protein A [Streptomyces sp. or43]